MLQAAQEESVVAAALPVMPDAAKSRCSALLELMALPTLSWTAREKAMKCMLQLSAEEKQLLLTVEDFKGARALQSYLIKASSELADCHDRKDRHWARITSALMCLPDDSQMPANVRPDLLPLMHALITSQMSYAMDARAILDKWSKVPRPSEFR